MTTSKPVILEVALNGVTPRTQNPAVPLTPPEIADDGIACLDAGAVVVHTHTHEFAVGPEDAAAIYLAAYRPILDRHPRAILYPTTGYGTTGEERYRHHEILARAGAIRAGLIDPGSVNLGTIGPDGLPVPVDFVYKNSPADVRHQIETCNRYGLAGSVAIFEPGFLRTVLACHRAGTLPAGTFVKLYFSEPGYFGEGEPMFSPPPIPEALDLYLAMIGEADLPWAVAVLGGSLLDTPIARLALERGGHLRVGLEDNVRAASNLAEVERAKQLCTEFGRPLASLIDTEALLGLPAKA